MADETTINGEFSDAMGLEISDEEDSKISGLTQKTTALEQENKKIIHENKEYKQRIEELTTSVKDVNAENVDFKKRVENAESDNKGLLAVAARAADLEAEVARLQHDLVSAMSDLQESNVELSDVKKNFEEMKGRVKEKDVKLEAIEKEMDLLLVKVKKLEENENDLRNEMEGKEKEIQGLRKKTVELGSALGENGGLEKLKSELEKKVEEMKCKIGVLESNLSEEVKVKERLIMESVNGGIDGETAVGGEKKGLIGGLKGKDLALVVGSAVSALSVIGTACYLRHAASKHA